MNRSSRVPIIIVLVLLTAGVLVAWLASRETSDTGSTSPVYPPNAYVHGASLDEWTSRHWQWTLSFPVGMHPGQDATGELCTMGQAGGVYFMPRNLAPCTVPEGVILVLPIAGGACSSVEAAPYWGGDEATLKACAAREAERYRNISVTVDGKSIPGIERYRTSPPVFSAVLPERNILGVKPGAAWVAADGYLVLIRPLPPGEHTIIVHTETVEGVVLPDKLLQLTVAEPAWGAPQLILPGATPVTTPATPPITPATN